MIGRAGPKMSPITYMGRTSLRHFTFARSRERQGRRRVWVAAAAIRRCLRLRKDHPRTDHAELRHHPGGAPTTKGCTLAFLGRHRTVTGMARLSSRPLLGFA